MINTEDKRHAARADYSGTRHGFNLLVFYVLKCCSRCESLPPPLLSPLSPAEVNEWPGGGLQDTDRFTSLMSGRVC